MQGSQKYLPREEANVVPGIMARILSNEDKAGRISANFFTKLRLDRIASVGREYVKENIDMRKFQFLVKLGE